VFLCHNKDMKLVPSAHFKKRIAERGVSWQECEETISKPDRKKIGDKGVQGGVRTTFEKDFYDKDNNKKLNTIVVVIGEKLPKSDNIIGISAWKKQ